MLLTFDKMLLKLPLESAFDPLNDKTNTSHLKLVLSNFVRDVWIYVHFR